MIFLCFCTFHLKKKESIRITDASARFWYTHYVLVSTYASKNSMRMDQYFQCNVQFTLPAFTRKSLGVNANLGHELCSFRRPLF